MMLEGVIMRGLGNAQGRLQTFLRAALSPHVTNGLTVSLGLILIMLAIDLVLPRGLKERLA